MTDTNLLPFTLLAGAAFGCALLWVLVQWLRADEIVDTVEREVQASIQLAATPAAPMEPSAEDVAREAYETELASLLWWWGLGGAVVGMALGGLWSSFTGALLGGFVAPILTTLGVLVAMKLKARRPVEAAAPQTTESEAEAPQGTPHHAA
jgi:predicted lipid-binding transport protein (Tim44 family)